MTVLIFSEYRRHARASAGSPSMGAGMAASVSKVIRWRPRLTAKPTMAAQRPGGMPRRRQVLTVESCTPSSAAMTALTPSSSNTVSGVMVGDTSWQTANCQGLANGSLTDEGPYGQIRIMGKQAKLVGDRLRATRLALGYAQQVDFCSQIGVDKGSYSNFEAGKRPLTLRIAIKIKERWEIPLDWLYCGDKGRLPAELYEKIIRVRRAA